MCFLLTKRQVRLLASSLPPKYSEPNYSEGMYCSAVLIVQYSGSNEFEMWLLIVKTVECIGYCVYRGSSSGKENRGMVPSCGLPIQL